MSHLVVVGASLAGLRACESLRTEGFDGRITLIGAETEVPYDRPPLSKRVLSGEWDAERIRLRKADDFESLSLTLRLGVRATALHPARKAVALDDGSEVAYDGLIIATGASPRRLPGQPAAAQVAPIVETCPECWNTANLSGGMRMPTSPSGRSSSERTGTAAR